MSEKEAREFDRKRLVKNLENRAQRTRGKWILGEYQREEDISNGNYMFFCSNCLYSDIHAKTVEVPYCWYCGADMRGTE